MREHEITSFCRVLETSSERFRVFDLLSERPGRAEFDGCDVFLLGGSGHYSAASEGEWLERALETMREIHDSGKPTFASCWGFQAMARAMGGTVVKDLSRAEVGSHELFLTDAGKDDPVFSPLGEVFHGQMGHEDCVTELPADAVLLASSDRVENQAYRFRNKPIYCTQFHPELNCSDLMRRVTHYPEYIERIAGLPPERFPELIRETPKAELLLQRFVRQVFES